jgi:hypothetical protein
MLGREIWREVTKHFWIPSESGGNKFLRNIGIYLPDYMVSRPRTQQITQHIYIPTERPAIFIHNSQIYWSPSADHSGRAV